MPFHGGWSLTEWMDTQKFSIFYLRYYWGRLIVDGDWKGNDGDGDVIISRNGGYTWDRDLWQFGACVSGRLQVWFRSLVWESLFRSFILSIPGTCLDWYLSYFLYLFYTLVVCSFKVLPKKITIYNNNIYHIQLLNENLICSPIPAIKISFTCHKPFKFVLAPGLNQGVGNAFFLVWLDVWLFSLTWWTRRRLCVPSCRLKTNSSLKKSDISAQTPNMKPRSPDTFLLFG